jgi:hypothetical protein
MARRRRKLEFHREAALEAREAAEWYGERSLHAKAKFKAALRRAERSVTQHPESWATYLHGTRCLKLNRFPYALVYVQRSDRIIGIAVAHLKRRPGYWRKRLAD